MKFCQTWGSALSILTLSLSGAQASIVGRQDDTGATPEQLANQKRTFSIGIVAFEGWEPLDIFGPLEVFFQLSRTYKMTLSIISEKTGPVTAVTPQHAMMEGEPPMDVGFMLGPQLTATHTYENAPALDILLIPGGGGNVVLDVENNSAVEDFVARRFDQLDYLLSVCTGTVSLAKSGVLNGRRATTNKARWDWVTGYGDNITWVPSARWVEDGKLWTSSGVAAGIDMAYAFTKHLYGPEVVDDTMNIIEYAPHTDPDWDPFSVVHDVPGANKNMSLVDCSGPAGYE
ncbi:hypothetical protein FQN54_004959 [Arachnomyces sp. PD_36]|nr:hypothetical protein FQN54_004959 [Arachnomyces sp. PD_36]